MNRIVAGMDIGGTSIRTGLVDAGLVLSGFEKHPQQEILCGEDPLESLADYLQDYLNRNSPHGVDALAIGLPAAMSRDRTTVLNAPNVDGLNGRNIVSFLQGRFPFPVYLERDVSMLFYYDRLRCRIPSEGIVIGCYVGTGLGNVIAVDGKLLAGNNGVACELGHIPAWGEQEICSCGNVGCMESFVGGKYLAKLQREHYPQIPIGELFDKVGDSPELTHYLEHLSIPIATEITLLNPAVILLGGGVLSMKGFPRQRLEQMIYQHTRKPLPAEELHFVYSDNQGENGVLGAAIYAMEQLDKQ